MLALAFLSGCASQMPGPSASVPGNDAHPPGGTGIADARLPHQPLDTIDTRSGMHSRSSEAVLQAVSQLGTPYQWGGESTTHGFDCSGLAQYAYEAANLSLPRTSRLQYRATRRVSRDELRPGDLVFFHLHGRHVDHVGIYVGDNRFIHAPSTGKTVSFAHLDNAYWARHYVSGGRVAEANELQLAGNEVENR